ncbi:hypothetical protein [Erythrobacter aureus]|uniref:Uncharacterized protein n=1 Tax=Erythrobacter aureus TaxID=2182384 RepID=A0A345YIH2_9SPHN|nr:hypothetical protein [Erythrobacter aureus]AXK43724.1 hypothetical protein DVR09_14800 [Erythrobacter aureus]
MTERPKPFAYDVVETPDALLFVIGHQGGDARPALGYLLGPRGLQINRADGVVIRMIHLHPRVLENIGAKPIGVIEVDADDTVLYSADANAEIDQDILSHLSGQFYWYLSPETASVDDVARRPFSQLLEQLAPQAVAVAPGEWTAGPLVGLCNSRRGIVTLTSGRDWAHPSRGLIIDRTLAEGITAGYPANDNIAECVALAHSDTAPALLPRERGPGSSQLGMAFLP